MKASSRNLREMKTSFRNLRENVKTISRNLREIEFVKIMKSSFRNLREIEYPKCFGTILHFGGAIYSVIHISIHPSKELCSKMAPGEVGVSLP